MPQTMMFGSGAYERAIQAADDKQTHIAIEYADKRDSKGNPFDPDIHVTDDDGRPKLTKSGKLRMRPGRKSASNVSVGPTSNAAGLSPQQKLQARQAGDAAANSLIMLGVVLGGEEWHPIKDESTGLDEKAHLTMAFGDYFEAKEMTDIPPGVALTIAVSAYALPRFTMPQTKTRMQKFKEWTATKIAKRRMKKNGPQPDSRNDGKRKDDTSEGTSETP